MNERIDDNIRKHERIAGKYSQRHPEIYNDAEQRRLGSAVDTCLSLLQTASQPPHVLDYGCGEGNLTRHFLDRGCLVTASDVTPGFLTVIRDRMNNDSALSTMLLNGTDLREVQDAAYDVVAAYSVLHHIPDYMAAVADCVRVLKPGGILFLDHEQNLENWSPSTSLTMYRRLTEKVTPLSYYIRSLASPSWYIKKYKKIKNPRYQEEGDIHVWPDDHIEWDRLQRQLETAGVETIVFDDYLSYKPHVDSSVHEQYQNLCSDMKLYIGRKR